MTKASKHDASVPRHLDKQSSTARMDICSSAEASRRRVDTQATMRGERQSWRSSRQARLRKRKRQSSAARSSKRPSRTNQRIHAMRLRRIRWVKRASVSQPAQKLFSEYEQLIY